MRNRILSAALAAAVFVLASCNNGSTGGSGRPPVQGLPVDSSLPTKIVEVIYYPEGFEDFGVKDNAGDGKSAFYVNLSAANSLLDGRRCELEFKMASGFNAAAYDYFMFDFYASVYDTFKEATECYPRFWGPEGYVEFNGNAAIRAAIEGAGGIAKWVTVKVPITENNKHTSENDADNYAASMARVTQFRPRILLSQDYIANPTGGELYVRNFRMEKDTLNSRITEIVMDGPAGADVGTVMKDGKNAWYLKLNGGMLAGTLPSIPGGGRCVPGFTIAPAYNASTADWLVYEINADSFATLDAVTPGDSCYMRFWGTVGGYISFGDRANLRAAIDGAGGEAKWLTVRIPVSERAEGGMNMNQTTPEESGIAEGMAMYEATMPSVRRLRFDTSFTAEFYANIPANATLYFADFRFE